MEKIIRIETPLIKISVGDLIDDGSGDVVSRIEKVSEGYAICRDSDTNNTHRAMTVISNDIIEYRSYQ